MSRLATARSAAPRHEVTSLRRQPVQERSTRRVAKMLDASAELIEESGYEALSTTLIAKRAGVAVGSLYQFFPDKRAVVQALTQRNLETFLATVSDQLASTDHRHWWGVVDSLIDVYVRMHREVPGFSAMHFGDIVDVRLLDEERDNNQVLSDMLTDLLDNHLNLPVEQTALPISVAVEAADALLNLAFRRTPDGDRDIVDESKQLLKGYLANRLRS